MRAGILHGSIRKKLALLFLISALPAFLVILFFGLKASNDSTAAAEHNLKHFVRELADTQARTTASVGLLLETLAKVPEVRQAKASACVELFASLLKEHPHLTTINLVGLSGDLIASATGTRSANFAHTRHFQDALKRKRFATGEYLVGITAKVPVFAFGYPVLDEQGQPKYLLLTSIRLDTLDRQFQNMSFPAASFVGACDHRGLRLYRHPANSAGALGQPVRRPVFEAAVANSEGLIEDTGSDGISRMVTYSPLRLSPDEPPYMYVFSGVPKSAIMAKARSELIDNMGLFLLAVALALVSGWFFGGRALGTKLEEMATASNRIGAGEHSVRVDPDTDISEIATLARSFNSMAESLARDISDRKKAEEELRETKDHLQAIFRVAPTGIGVVKNRVLVRVNQCFCDMTGYAEEELLGQSARMLYPSQEDFDFVGQEKYRQISEKGTGEIETRFLRKDGTIIDVFMASTPLDPRDLSHGVTFTAMDITERKKAEDALRESEARFRMLFDNISSVAVQGYDQSRAVVYWNEASTRFYGYSREEAIGRQLEDLIIPPFLRPMVIESVRAWVEENTAIPAGELDLMRKDGSTISVFSSHVMQRFNNGASIMYCLDIDLSELSTARADLVRAKESAEAANRSKSLFLANMSHELRTPLNGVLGMLQLIRTSSTLSEVEGYAEMGIRAGQRLTGLLGDILDLSRIEAGRMPITSKPFTMSNIFVALAETFSPMHYSKSLSLVINASPDVPAEVVGDEIRVRQILFNLVGNAMKFSNQGEVRVEASTLLPHPAGQARLLFIISDTGLGIPDDQIDEICRPFIQVSSDFTRSHQGAGLGLSIARRLIDAMGGTLTFESTEGQGTSVYLVLPFGIPKYSAIPATPESVPDAGSGAPLRLLLVEDDEISRLSARLALEKMGHRVDTAHDGRQALDVLRREAYDCVLMDVQMDVMDGVATTRLIRSGQADVLDAQVPVIAMTAYAMSGDRERFLAAGMDDYIPKPIRIEELKKTLGRVAGRKGKKGSR